MRFVRVLIFANLCSATFAHGDQSVIHFDLPPVTVARPVEAELDDDSLVTIELKLSSMIATPDVPRIDQWLVQCQPRDTLLSIADYAPRTEVASDITGPIQIKKSNESTKSIGIAVDGAYGYLAHANSGIDRGSKDIDSYQLDRIAPVQAVTASGTINRGLGVFFKLRWTAQQVLEGEKTFRLTLRVPANWRAGLIDVSVIAQSGQKTFPGWESETKTLGSADFVVAAYRQGDLQAAAQARQLFDAEYTLRSTAREYCSEPSPHSLTSLLHSLASKLDHQPNSSDLAWIDRLLLCRADPHFDKEIRKLPMPVRVAVLDYVDIRDSFLAINDTEDQQ